MASLAKCLCAHLWTKWLWVRVQLQSLKFQIWHLLQARRFLTFRQLEHGFTMKRVCDMIRTYGQMHCTNRYSQHSSIIWPDWANGCVFVYKLSGCGFKSSCSHLNFRFRTCFKQGVSWHSGNYRVWIHSETHMWHVKNIQQKNNKVEIITPRWNDEFELPDGFFSVSDIQNYIEYIIKKHDPQFFLFIFTSIELIKDWCSK